MRRLALAVLLCALAAMPASALDRNAFAFTRYDLHLILDPHQHGLAVEGTVECATSQIAATRSRPPNFELAAMAGPPRL